MPRRKRPWRHLKRLVIHRKSSCRGHPRVRVQFSNETPFYFPLMLWTASPSIVNDVRALIRPNIFSAWLLTLQSLYLRWGGARGHDVGLTLIFLLLSICIELRSSLRNFESQNEYGYKPCIKRRFQNAETLQSRNQTNSS